MGFKRQLSEITKSTCEYIIFDPKVIMSLNLHVHTGERWTVEAGLTMFFTVNRESRNAKVPKNSPDQSRS